MLFEELKRKYKGEIVNDKGFDEINENEWIFIENNGNSGKEIGRVWLTAQLLNKNNEVVDEFDFYTKY